MNNKDLPKELIDLEARLKSRLLLEANKKRNSIIKRRKLIGIAASVAITFSIGLKPIASFVTNKLDETQIAKISNFEPGLMLAIENGIMQDVSINESSKNLKMTIQEVLMDDSGMMVFYSLENLGDYKEAILEEVVLEDENSAEVAKGYFEVRDSILDISNLSKYQSRFIFDFDNNEIESNVNLVAKFSVKNSDDSLEKISYTLPFEIDNKVFEGKKSKYIINENVSTNAGEITFKTLEEYPMRNVVRCEINELDNVKLLGFDSMAIIDEDGERYNYMYKRGQRLYFSSSYYKPSDSFRLVGANIKYLDENYKIENSIDLNNKRWIIKGHDKFEIAEMRKTDVGYDISIIIGNFDMRDLNSDIEVRSNRATISRSSLSYIENTNQTILNLGVKTNGDDSFLDFEIENYPKVETNYFDIEIGR